MASQPRRFGLSKSKITAFEQCPILAAMERCDVAGSVESFIASHEGLQNPKKFWILHYGKRYPCKAIVRDALSHIGSDALAGGARSKSALDALSFVVIDWPAFEALRETFLSRMNVRSRPKQPSRFRGSAPAMP